MLERFVQTLESLLGFKANLTKRLDAKAVLEILTFRDRQDIDRMLLVGDICNEEAEIYAMRGLDAENRLADQRSLRLYLEAF